MIPVSEDVLNPLGVTPDRAKAVKDEQAGPAKISSPLQAKMRRLAVDHFFPDHDMKLVGKSKTLFADPSETFWAVALTARVSKSRLWYGLKQLRLPMLAEAECAYLILCGMVGDDPISYRLPLTVVDGVPHVCDQPLTSTSKDRLNPDVVVHYNLTVLATEDGLYSSLDIGHRVVIDLKPFSSKPVFVQPHWRDLPKRGSPPDLNPSPEMAAYFEAMLGLAADAPKGNTKLLVIMVPDIDFSPDTDGGLQYGK